MNQLSTVSGKPSRPVPAPPFFLPHNIYTGTLGIYYRTVGERMRQTEQ